MPDEGSLYVALLRAVNVGGRTVPMAELRRAVAEAGFSEVRSFIQTGNLCLRSDLGEPEAVARRLGETIHDAFGLHSDVMVRGRSEMEALLRSSPFAASPETDGLKRYVSFLAEPPAGTVETPLRSERDGLELIAVAGREAFCLSRPVRGRYGFPNPFVERELDAVATTRNWRTVERMWRAWGLGG